MGCSIERLLEIADYVDMKKRCIDGTLQVFRQGRLKFFENGVSDCKIIYVLFLLELSLKIALMTYSLFLNLAYYMLFTSTRYYSCNLDCDSCRSPMDAPTFSLTSHR